MAQGVIAGGAALSVGEAFSSRAVSAIPSTSSAFQPYNYIVYSATGVIYALNGNTGNIDYESSNAAHVIQYAIDHTNAVNPSVALDTLGGRVFIKNMGLSSPYQIDSQINFRSYVQVESDGATLRNNRGSILQFPFASDPNRVLYRARIRGLIFDVNNAGNGVGLAFFGPQRSEFDLAIENCATGLDLRSALPGTQGIEPVLGRSASLSEYNLQVDNCQRNAALQLSGDSGAPVTNNHFIYFRASNVGITGAAATGIALVQWCDTIKFDNVWIGLTGNGSVGVNFNNSTTQNMDVGVYNILFDKLAVNAFGLTGVNAIYLNYSRGIKIDQFFASPKVNYVDGTWSSGTLINRAYPQSYEIGDYASRNDPPFQHPPLPVQIVQRSLNVVQGT